MEYIDILDEEGNKTGQKATKDEIHQKGLWHRAVHVWILNSKGELLLQRRSKKVNNYPDMWDISAAGHVSAGQSATEAAVREVAEELGLKLSLNQLRYVGEAIQKNVMLPNGDINNEYNDIFLVKLDFKLSDLRFNDGEVSEVKWVFWREVKRWMENKNNNIVPHPDEEEILFKYLENL